MKLDFKNIESFNPRDCISGKIKRSNRIIDEIFRKYIAPFGITNSQLSIMFVASKNELFTQNFISEKLFLEKSTVSRNIKLLLKKDYLKKEQKNIEITLKGKKLIERIIPEWKKAMKEAKQKLTLEGEDALNLLTNKLTH
jgi:DNA-binding MarR family transcriptional regulator